MKAIPTQRRFVSPDWHKKVLMERLAKVEAGKGKFLTIAQLENRFVKRATP